MHAYCSRIIGKDATYFSMITFYFYGYPHAIVAESLSHMPCICAFFNRNIGLNVCVSVMVVSNLICVFACIRSLCFTQICMRITVESLSHQRRIFPYSHCNRTKIRYVLIIIGLNTWCVLKLILLSFHCERSKNVKTAQVACHSVNYGRPNHLLFRCN